MGDTMYHTTHMVPTAEQRALITEQLGRTPRGLEAIVAVDGEDTPLVLQVAPLVDDKPFPTFYWLSSPLLIKALSRLEAKGVIKSLEAQLKDDDVLMTAYQASHQDYVARRWAAMSEKDRQRIDQLGFTTVFEKRGIGGIENWQQVRCLHTQYAHHLASGGQNAIGQWVDTHYCVVDLLP